MISRALRQKPISWAAWQKIAALLIVGGPAAADQNEVEVIDEILVFGRATQHLGTAQSASEGMVGFDDIQKATLLRVGELTEAIPGMVATQHSGTGKANQFFLRGFNLDHGTDFSGTADGVPLNMRTHGHGQGYLDLNFLIPELIATTTYHKGPYTTEVGDFSSAGSVAFGFYDSLDEMVVGATVGGNEFYRGIVAGSVNTGSGVLTTALDVSGYDGPWQLDEEMIQRKFYVSYTDDFGAVRGKLSLQGYDGTWNSTDQIPRRAVESGLINPLGNIDPDLGGQTQRSALTVALDFGSWEAQAYLIDYDFTLYSNFTYFLNDPVFGDQFEQRDNRRVYGATVKGLSEGNLGGRLTTIRWGGNLRLDDINEVGLYDTVGRVRTATIRQDAVEEVSIGAFGEVEIALTERLRMALGLRADYYDWNVAALRLANSGTGSDQLLSPKVNVAYRFSDRLEGYANWGMGFHSNDVRGTTITIDPRTNDPARRVAALVRSEGAEAGLRFEHGRRFNATLVAFRVALDSELVFVGDAGTTEPSGSTERVGFEASTFWQANDWLAINAAYSVTDARFKHDSGGRHIPGTIGSTFTLGLYSSWDNGLGVNARVRYLGDSPLTSDGTVRSSESLLANLGIAYRRNATEYRLDLFNLFDSNDDDISYYYASRLPGEAVGGVTDVHFHPLEPRTVRASVHIFWN